MTLGRPKRVLFLCIGNMCRSPMAEGFARSLAPGVIEAWSAGFSPSGRLSEDVVKVMAERGVDIRSQRSKGIHEVPLSKMDWIVSLGEVSARAVAPPGFRGRVEDWRVRDPLGESLDVVREARDEIERRVRGLIDAVRSEASPVADS